VLDSRPSGTYGQVGLAQEREPEQSFVGCYELRIEGRPRIDYGNEFLPKRFELNDKRVYGGFAAKSLESRVHWDLRVSSWHLQRDGSLMIDWSTGYVGWAIQLRKSGTDDLSGTARFWTDTDCGGRPSGVTVHTAKCTDLSGKS